jgi:hypothetical protein
MTQEWQVKSVVKSGDSIHVELQQQDSGPVGPVGLVLCLAFIAVLLWAFYAAVILDPSEQRNRVWTAASNQLLECGDSLGNSVVVYWSDVDTIQAVQRPARGAVQYTQVTVQPTATGAWVQGPDVAFEYRSADRLLAGSDLGAGQVCQVRLTR